MSRPRTIPDASVLQAAQRVFARLGPDFTLADVAAAAGLAPATLVQRFGSKRGLLLALAQMAAEGAGACFFQVRAAHRSPLRALFGCVDAMACLAESPQAFAHSLGFLQMDLTDPEFRHWAQLNARAQTAGYRGLIDDCVRARELKPCDAEGLARLIQAAIHGSMVSWAVHQKGTVLKWMRRDLEFLLSPYIRKARPGKSRRSTGQPT